LDVPENAPDDEEGRYLSGRFADIKFGNAKNRRRDDEKEEAPGDPNANALLLLKSFVFQYRIAPDGRQQHGCPIPMALPPFPLFFLCWKLAPHMLPQLVDNHGIWK
jgi:hypothetical protein